MKIFAVLDTKAEAYHLPFFSPTIGTALRMITEAVNDPSSLFYNHAEDYTLFQLGEWDEKLGRILLDAAKLSVCNLAEIRRRVPANLPLFGEETKPEAAQ